MLSKFSVKKPYTVVVGVVLIIILGIVTFMEMTVDLLPNMNMPYAIVMTTYQGASPEEVETVVTRPVEQTMATVSNIKNIQSTSSENMSTVMLEFEQTANMDSATIEMREGLDQISGYWPDTVMNPIIMKLNPDMMPVLISAVSISGEGAEDASKTIEEQIIPELESVEGVASVSTYGSIEQTVEITINEQKIKDLNVEVKAELDKKFAEASSALSSAKSQAEEGKAALEAAKAQGASQLSDAESQISVKAEEIKQAQLEIAEKKAEINVGAAQLEQAALVLQASKTGIQSQIGELDALKASESQISQRYEALNNKASSELTEEEQAELLSLTIKMEALNSYEQSRQQLSDALTVITEQENTLKNQQGQLKEGMNQLESIQTQVNEGALTLAGARGQLSSAQLAASVGISEGSTQLMVGEAAIAQQEAAVDDAKKEALHSADLNSILTADMVKALLAAENFNMPAGYVNESGLDYLVRVGEKFKSIEDIGDLVILNMDQMDVVKLSDVASVKLVSNSDETYAKINGESGVMLSMQKQTGYSTKDVSSRVLEKMNTLKKSDASIQAVTLMDQGIYIDLIVNSVLQNLAYGAVLAIIILLVFLKSIRPTLVIACSIPISILTALVAMYFSGITLNIISLSGLALGVGMLVDNSIVVIENIYRMRNEEGASAKQAAIEGARQVAGAITASTLTTICVFVPIVFAKGVTRQLFVDMGLTIAYSLLASLLVALTLVPMMSAGLLKKTEEKESRVFANVRDHYGNLLRKALKLKPVVLIGSLLLLAASGILAFTNGTAFMPDMESTEVSMTLELPKGSTMQDTVKAADQVLLEVGKIEDIKDIGGMIGDTSGMGLSGADNVAQFYGITVDKPKLNNKELKKEIERVTEKLDGELTVSMSNMDMSALGSSGINVQIKGRELDKLQEISGEIKDIVSSVKGTQNVLDGTEDNKEELRVVVDKTKAMKHNLTVAQVYQELSGKLSEARTATTLSTDTEEFDVYVLDDVNESMNREDVKNLTLSVEKQDGTKEEVKLSDIASFEDTKGFKSIIRKGQSRCISVTAELKDGENIGIVSDRVKKALKDYEAPEGYEVKMTGEDETINDAMTEVMKMMALAIVFMYLIMVAQFQSLRSPFIVMFTVPLAFTGGFLGLWIAGAPVSVIAMVGFVMLAGIIVNNGIVFVDYTNQLMRNGMEQKDALVEAGRTRLRPINMTALTTILGLSTMAAGVGMGSDMVQPMAVVTIGGLLYGTLLTLFVVPCIFDLFHKREKARLRDEIEDE